MEMIKAGQICEMYLLTNHLPAVIMHLHHICKPDRVRWKLKCDGFNDFMKFPYMLKTSDAISKCNYLLSAPSRLGTGLHCGGELTRIMLALNSKSCPHNFNCKAATPFHNSKIKCVRVSASVTSITLPQHNFLIDNLRSKEWRVSRHPGMRRWWIFYKVFSTENQTQIRREPILTPEYREWSRLPVTLTYSRHWISCSGGRRCPPAAPWRWRADARQTRAGPPWSPWRGGWRSPAPSRPAPARTPRPASPGTAWCDSESWSPGSQRGLHVSIVFSDVSIVLSWLHTGCDAMLRKPPPASAPVSSTECWH